MYVVIESFNRLTEVWCYFIVLLFVLCMWLTEDVGPPFSSFALVCDLRVVWWQWHSAVPSWIYQRSWDEIKIEQKLRQTLSHDTLWEIRFSNHFVSYHIISTSFQYIQYSQPVFSFSVRTLFLRLLGRWGCLQPPWGSTRECGVGGLTLSLPCSWWDRKSILGIKLYLFKLLQSRLQYIRMNSKQLYISICVLYVFFLARFCAECL